MSKQTELMELEKCIVSRLWYVATVLHRDETSVRRRCQADVEKLKILIGSCAEQGLDEQKWIAYNFAARIDNDARARKKVAREEFLRTLESLDPMIPQKQREELAGLLEAERGAVQKSKVANAGGLSRESLRWLEANVPKYPTSIDRLINQLPFIRLPVTFAQTDLALQDIYFSSIEKLLRTLGQKPDEKSADRPDNVPLGALLSIVSKFELTEAREEEMRQWLYPAFLETTNSDDIALALYSRKNLEFFRAWHEFLDDTYAGSREPDNLENTLKICQLIFTPREDSTLLLNANEIFKRTLRTRSHWLTDILGVCHVLLTNGRYKEVEKIVATPVLKNFWLLLSLKILNESPSKTVFPVSEEPDGGAAVCLALRFALKKLRENTGNDSSLKRLVDALDNRSTLLDWILKNTKSGTETERNGASTIANRRNWSVNEVLNLLQNHSVLAVLKTTTDIHSKPRKDIRDLLSNEKTSLNAFRAYSTMLGAFEAILACESYSEKYEKVAEHLNETEKSLGRLFPLDLRLRVIENIFSMLFLRKEDFLESDSGEAVSGEDSSPTGESFLDSETGFFCNEYAAREILGSVKRSVAAASLEYREQKKEAGSSCDISEEFEKKAALVARAVVDATWRLELSTSLEFVQGLGILDSEARETRTRENGGEALPREARLGRSGRSKKKKTMLYGASRSSSDESDATKSDSDGRSSGTGSQDNTSSNSGRGKGWKNQTTPRNEVTRTKCRASKKPELVINCMLASRESLVLRCLWNNDYDRASRVIEMFGLKNSRLDGEIQFSRAMRTFRKQMTAKSKSVADSVDSPDGISERATLENIRKAVQDGFQRSRTTSRIETFLAAQESSVRLSNSEATSVKRVSTIASLDLALTIPRDHRDSTDLMDASTKRLKRCKKLANTRYDVFFERVYELLRENGNDSSTREVLCDARIPLSVKGAREKKERWSRIIEKLESFGRSMDDDDDDDDDDDEVVSVCENGEPYLHRLRAHLKLLGTIVADNNGTKSLLETCLHRCIGDRIFGSEAELRDVESIASRLGVNLVHSVLLNCCPRSKCLPETRRKLTDDWGFAVMNEYDDESGGSDDNAYHEPNECVGDILSELVEAIREETAPGGDRKLGRVEVGRLSERRKIVNILKKSGRLRRLDLSDLSFGHRTLVFFINLWNLMMIHALLRITAKDPPNNHLRHEIWLSSVGYEIGDLGTVSLATLGSKLLGRSLLGAEEYFSPTEESNEPAWQDLDVPHEPRCVFSMINEYEDSPILRIYRVETLDDDLEASMSDYLEHYRADEKKPVSPTNARATSPSPDILRLYRSLVEKKGGDSREDRDEKGLVGSPGKSNYAYRLNFSYVRGESRDSSRRDEGCAKPEIKSMEIPWRDRTVEPFLLRYLEGHCWLVSYLVERIHDEGPTIPEGNREKLPRTAALENLFGSSWTKNLKRLYEKNETVAGLRKVTTTGETWSVLERLLRNGEANECLDILNSLPDSAFANDTETQRLRDKILAKVAVLEGDRKTSETMKHVYRIKNVHVLAQMIIENAKDLSVRVCQRSIVHLLGHRNKAKLPAHCQSRINEILCRVRVFSKLSSYCATKNTEDAGPEAGANFDDDDDDDSENRRAIVRRTEQTNPVEIVKSLIDAKQYELCLEWLEHQALSSGIHSLITEDLLVGLLTNGHDDFKHAFKLLRALPIKRSINLCNGLIGKLDSVAALRFVVGYLRDNASSSEDSPEYRRILLGIDVLDQLDPEEKTFYVHLVEQPLLMLEQLLMNCRLDRLRRIIDAARAESHKFHVHSEDFDERVRFYAKKSLDLRVAVRSDPIERIRDRASTSSNDVFAMPPNVPTKEEWVPNDKARECGCCRLVIFSMFNRRHHCRRCGRVVCGACSPQRMTLPSYPNSVPVRVCNDCKRQSLVRSRPVPSTPSISETPDCWRLRLDETHNETLRDEFSFENAPNVSLCLAILNLHSDHEAYSNFLLDRCDEFKRLLRPDDQGRVNPEIDHALIIKMIRSLLVAAKVKCAELGSNTGLAHCDRFLSQVDLIATLVNSDCSYLVPRMDKDDHLDDHTLRRLRDTLTEKEQWTVALDVGTKTGLDTQGVWAAWGTACLKVGYYERAREKFVHCLDKVSRQDSDDWVVLSYPGESCNETNGRLGDSCGWKSDDARARSAVSRPPQDALKNRPGKDPPLLTEILLLLERANPSEAHGQRGTRSKFDPPREIFRTLSSLGAVSSGQSHFAIARSSPATLDRRYHESLYYLLAYGSFNSILGFFVKHNEYEKCLDYVIENELEPELFVNAVFLPCARNGRTTNLCESMRSKDPSLLTYKKYLMRACHTLERKRLLHTLHQLQLFMKDYVRASMTCIRFYLNDATSYQDLSSRTHFLLEAQKHLESELELDGLRKKRAQRASLGGQNALTLEMDPIEIDRHANTISRQMEIAKFLGNREQEGRSVGQFIDKLSYMDSEGSSPRIVLPTLFGDQQEKTHLAVLAILCGRDVEEGFGIAFRIMQDYDLRARKIYSLVGHMLALDRKISSIEQLVKCCRSSGAPNSSSISDRVLAHCVKLLLDRSRADSNPSPKDQVDTLIRIITDVELKIDSYIESGQLKAAYLLAVKHSRAQDIRKILKEADRLGQSAIKSICTKWLRQTQKTRGDL